MPKKEKMPATNTSQTSAQEITSDRKFRLAARDKYALEVARAVEKEMEAEYTAEIPKYNKERKLLVGPEDFWSFFKTYKKRCEARCAAERASAVDENVLPHTLPELVGKMQEYLGEDGESGVVGVWPVAVLRIPNAVVERLHRGQSLKVAVEANEKIDQMVAEYVEGCARDVGIEVQLAEDRSESRRIGRAFFRELREELEEATKIASAHPEEQGKSSSSSTQTRCDEAFSAFFFQILCQYGLRYSRRFQAEVEVDARKQFCKRVMDQASLALVKRLEDLGFAVHRLRGEFGFPDGISW